MNDETPADASAEVAAKCRATTAKGKPCRNRAHAGSDCCAVHAGLGGMARSAEDASLHLDRQEARDRGRLRVEIILAGTATATVLFLGWQIQEQREQNSLLRSQVMRQVADTLIVRRATPGHDLHKGMRRSGQT